MLILCNGMMRSGSTLQYNIVRNLVEHLNRGEAHGFIHEKEFKHFAHIFDNWAKSKSDHVVKVHSLYPESLEMTAAGKTVICYIYRDIRDVALSAKNKFGLEGKNLYEELDHSISVYYALRDILNIIRQKYEEVITDLPNAVRFISEKLGYNASNRIIHEVAEECSLNSVLDTIKNIGWWTKLKHTSNKHFSYRVEKLASCVPQCIRKILKKTPIATIHDKIALPIPQYDHRTLIHPDHISDNRGVIGSWRNGLEEEDLCYIMEHYTLWLHDAGYID